MHPFLLAFIVWTVAVSIILIANYIHHKNHSKIHTIEDDQEFWDNSLMYDDLFLNQN